MGHRPKFPRPPDPPGQSAEALDRLVKEAQKLCEEILPDKNPFVKHEVPLKDYLTPSEMRRMSGLKDPYRMDSAVPPTTRNEIFDTSLLYHPATYMNQIVTGSAETTKIPDVFKYKTAITSSVSVKAESVRPPPPPPTSVPGPGRPVIRERESEWKTLWKMIKAWWQRDFGQKLSSNGPSSGPVPPQVGQDLPGGTSP